LSVGVTNSSLISVPAAIEFQRQQKWDTVRDRCHHLASQTRRRINALTGYESICPETTKWFGEMCAVYLPDTDLPTLKTHPYDEFRIEVPVFNCKFQAINPDFNSEIQ
jgi:hypothetical protein